LRSVIFPLTLTLRSKNSSRSNSAKGALRQLSGNHHPIYAQALGGAATAGIEQTKNVKISAKFRWRKIIA
jgi:hypothetical protein